ncbi:MAG: hypothetical protein AAF998_03660 [Bacteroidota bacterium]
MNWLQSLKHGYSLKVFEQRARKVTFPHAFVDLDKAASVGFIINMGLFSPEDLVDFTKYITRLEHAGKVVLVVELNFKRKGSPMFKDSVRSIFINPEQINWLGLPSVRRLQELNKARLDLLVNLDTSESMTSRYICGLSNARTRVGLHELGYEKFYELLLDMPRTTSMQELLGAFETFTKMLEK